MNIEVLDQNFDLIAVISEYESFIWTDRYNKPGDFEIYSPISEENLKYLVRDNYIRLDTSEHLMIIEDIVYQSSADGKHVQIVGRSLESILDRRIVWEKTDVDGNFQQQIQKLFNQNIINAPIVDRRISNFVFEPSTDEAITKLTLTNQYAGDTLLSIIETLTEEFDIGWKITLNDAKQFVFTFYTGTDRSYAQNTNSYVIFSPSYENVIESTYTVAGGNFKSVVLVAAEDSSYSMTGESVSLAERPKIYRVIGGGTGLLRRELYTTLSGVTQEEGESRESYERKLDQFGREELKKYTISKKFDGQYETRIAFRYGVDFFMGDTVEVADEFGNEGSSKIIEFIWSNNVSNGEEAYPTFRSNETNEE